MLQLFDEIVTNINYYYFFNILVYLRCLIISYIYTGFVHRSLSPALPIHKIPPLLQKYHNRNTQIMAQQFHDRLYQRTPGRNCACPCGKTKSTGGQQAVCVGHDRMRTTRKTHTFRTNNGTSSSGSRTRRYFLKIETIF